MFESIMNFLKKMTKKEEQTLKSKDAAKERLHLVLMQDRANVSADFLDLMKQEIIEVIKKYIDIDENAMDVRLTNKDNGDGSNGAPALYANIPILNIKDEVRQTAQVKQGETKKEEQTSQKESKKETNKKDNEKIEKEEQKEEGRRARQGEGKPSDHRQGRRCGAGIQPRHRRQGIYRPRRSVRLRQIDDAAYDRRSGRNHGG